VTQAPDLHLAQVPCAVRVQARVIVSARRTGTQK
jgi:hypothetical protein